VGEEGGHEDLGQERDELRPGIAVSAARLRSVAFDMSASTSTAAGVSAVAWRRSALTAAITADIASLTLHNLAMRAGRLSDCPVNGQRLALAATVLADARNAWEQAATMWRLLRTDTQSPVSPATIEAGDLVLRMGRLAFDNPGWTPARQQNAPLLRPEVLAPGAGELVATLDAVHLAADALARVAAADLLAIGVRQFYMPQVILRGSQGPARDYIAAPEDQVLLLKDVYRVIVSTSRTAAQALGSLAIDAGAPSRVLALARMAALRSGDPLHPPVDPQLSLDRLRPRLRTFGKRRGWQVIRLDELDADEVIRAYQEDQLTVRECARRFATSGHLIAVILDQNDIPVRTGRSVNENPADPHPHQPEPEPPRRGAAERRWWGPIERQLQARHVTDTGLLLRAAALDRAGRELLAQAETSRSLSEPTEASVLKASSLAAQDSPKSSDRNKLPAARLGAIGGTVHGRPSQRRPR
jgi:hypothetical protein